MPCGMNLEIEWEVLGRGLRSRDVSSSVHADELVRLDVRLLPVLPEAALLETLRGVLREQGWTDQADGSLSKTTGIVTASLTADGRAVEIRSSQVVSVRGQVFVEVERDTSEEAVEAALDREAGRQADALKARETAKLAQATMAALTAHEPEVRGELQRALNRTYRLGLETRARELGELESIAAQGDEGGTYEVTVVVKA